MTVDVNKKGLEGKSEIKMTMPTMQDMNSYFKTPLLQQQPNISELSNQTFDHVNQSVSGDTNLTFDHVNQSVSGNPNVVSSELSSRLGKLQLRDKHLTQCIPHRQPTIVCEDISDDIDIENECSSACCEDQTLAAMHCIDQSSDATTTGGETLTRSASTASLSVPQSIEIDEEKKRPPLPYNDQTQN